MVTEKYRSKNVIPLPDGDFSVKLHEVTRYVGKARYMEESQNISIRTAAICFQPEEADFTSGSDEPQTIGHIQFTIINKSRMINGKDGDSGRSFGEDCEALSQELADMYAAIYNKRGSPRSCNLLEYIDNDFLYLNEIRLEPEWRGYGIGLLALDGLLGLMPSFSMDAVVLCPAGLLRDTDNKDHVSVQGKLKKYFGLLGFSDWTPPSYETTLIGLWTGNLLPSIEKASRDPIFILFVA